MKPAQEQVIAWAREAFIARGFWPNEVMWACWKDSWLLAYEAGRKDENEACEAALREVKDKNGVNDDGRAWLQRASRSDFIAAIRARREQ